ncbi:MAG TPA: GNAT family N-acetyltransferase [Bacillota bacterium]|jgi:ribosomal protein S18 acetylase RimI-like enzyme|nr:GNAT family N-acetyltransferase [Bacillota bacterium]HOL09635.1 GNAT family N-acetyltransferase [Bacillota bacterium]
MMDVREPKITVETVHKIDDELREQMLAIDEEAFGAGSLNEWSLPPFLHYGRVYVARFNGLPVGIAELIRDWRDPEMAYLYGYAIKREYQGYGIGTIMFRTILEGLPRAGFQRLQLTVHPENKIALHIYQNKFGMKKVEFIKDYYGAGEDRWLMEWKAGANEE